MKNFKNPKVQIKNSVLKIQKLKNPKMRKKTKAKVEKNRNQKAQIEKC